MSRSDASLQAAIIEAAIQLGEELGTEGITMRGIAGRLSISATQIYQHFDGKRAILDELRLRANSEMLAHIVRGLDDGGIQGSARAYLEWALGNPWRYPLLMENETLAEADFNETQREEFERAHRDAALAVTKYLQVEFDANLARHFARWWAFLHGTAALILNKRIRPDQPAAPVADLDLFITESVTAATDVFLAAAKAKV